MSELGDLIRAEREKRGWTQQKLADLAGTNQSTIDRIERGLTGWSRKSPAILKALGFDPLQFDEKAYRFERRAAEPRSDATFQGHTPSLSSLGRVMIPRYAAVEGGPGVMIIEKTPLDYVSAPEHLANVEGAYTVYISGDSMFPEYEPGDTAEVNPRLPPLAGTTCIFYTNNAHDDRAMIKRLERIGRTEWHLRQWNPPEGEEAEFMVSRIEWPVCHRVVGRRPGR